MKKSAELVYIHIKKILFPLMSLVVITILLQCMGYKWSNAVTILGDNHRQIINTVKYGSYVTVIMMVIFLNESAGNRIAIRNLPVKRISLCLAKFTQVAISFVIVLLANYASISFTYYIFKDNIKRNVVFDWYNEFMVPIFAEAAIILLLSVVIALIYCGRNYSIKGSEVN